MIQFINDCKWLTCLDMKTVRGPISVKTPCCLSKRKERQLTLDRSIYFFSFWLETRVNSNLNYFFLLSQMIPHHIAISRVLIVQRPARLSAFERALSCSTGCCVFLMKVRPSLHIHCKEHVRGRRDWTGRCANAHFQLKSRQHDSGAFFSTDVNPALLSTPSSLSATWKSG